MRGSVALFASSPEIGFMRERLAGSVPQTHGVLLYPQDGTLARSVAAYVRQGLERGEPALLIVAPDHRESVCRHLRDDGVDVERAGADGRLSFLNAASTLDRILVDGVPDWTRFERAIGTALEEVRSRSGGSEIRLYGEMVDLLWKRGALSAAVRLEEYWSRILKTGPYVLF